MKLAHFSRQRTPERRGIATGLKKVTGVISVALLLMIFLAAGLTAPVISKENDLSLPAGETPFVENQLIIQVPSSAAASRIQQEFAGYQLKPVRQLSRRLNIWLFEYSAPNLKLSQQGTVLDAIRRSPDVDVAQFNHLVTQRQTIPDDPSFGLQWGLNNTGQSGGTVDADIDAPEAWDVIKGDTTLQGDQIVVAIVDGGCDINHTDISYFKNTHEIPGNGIDDDGNGYIDDYDGWNAYNNNGNVTSDSHGTHVAGIAAATGNNGIGVSGVNWGVKVMPVLGSSSNEAVVEDAYSYVYDMRATYNETGGAYGAFVVATNSSFGVDYGNPASYPIWCGMYDSMGVIGILSAAATANLNINIDVQGDVPTACPSDYLISVTNTTRNDVRNTGAAYGATTIDLGAPGTTIYSTLPGNSYGYLTGTSMATPHVCGAVGFLYGGACQTMLADMQTDPGAVALYVKDAILNGVDTLPSLLGSTVSGGRLNLYNALQIVQSYPCGLIINHTPVTDTKDYLNPIEIIAGISSPPGIDPDSALVFYSTDGGTIFSPELMTDYGGGEYHGFIPAQAPGTTVDYYVFARDLDGNRDSTQTFTFRVIDYDVLVSPSLLNGFGPANDTVSYLLTVTNNGTLNDDFSLTYSGNAWPVSLWDESGTTEITSTGTVLPDDSFKVLVRVMVPVSVYGDQDSMNVTATSGGNSSYFRSAAVVTTSVGVPLTLPVFDDFPDTLIDAAIWQQVSAGARIEDSAYNEPSMPYSLNLDGFPSGADTVVSQTINLNGASGVMVRYSYEQTGAGESPDANDDLFIEYLDSLGNWNLLSRQYGADPDEIYFTQVEVPLPGDAYHANFHLRIRNVATPGPYDDWFVDDVFIGMPYICGDVDGNGAGPDVSDLTYLVDYLFGGGEAPPNLDAANIDGLNSIEVTDLTMLVDFMFNGGSPPVCP